MRFCNVAFNFQGRTGREALSSKPLLRLGLCRSSNRSVLALGPGIGVLPEHRHCVMSAHVLLMQPRIKADTREPLRCRCLLSP